MRILVLSDSHGNHRNVTKVMQQHPTAEVIIHLGDGAEDLETERYAYPHKSFYQVCGNCDRCCEFPVTQIISVAGQRLLLTHGHAFGVKQTLTELAQYARSNAATIVLYGHTHQPMTRYVDHQYWMNPGALKENRYGIIDITDKGIVTNLGKLQD